MVAHLDSVTSLAVDQHGLYLISGSHDCSIRYVQESVRLPTSFILSLRFTIISIQSFILQPPPSPASPPPRLWNLESKTCVQEITAHRKKFDESIFDVAFHPSRPYIASAGNTIRTPYSVLWNSVLRILYSGTLYYL